MKLYETILAESSKIVCIERYMHALSPTTSFNDLVENRTGESSSCSVRRVFTALIMTAFNTTFEDPIYTSIATILPHHPNAVHRNWKTRWELGGGMSCEVAPLFF
ncbi:hypothetical protein KAS14_00200 [Candidatus Bathyarchaeota archaeon]|nr:hypothetical protein [Candidatus Bathyarchaeota archaeon]